jgi:hypothetical protein
MAPFIKKKLSRPEKILFFLLIIALLAVILRWDKIKQGFIKGWERYGIEEWFSQ